METFTVTIEDRTGVAIVTGTGRQVWGDIDVLLDILRAAITSPDLHPHNAPEAEAMIECLTAAV